MKVKAGFRLDVEDGWPPYDIEHIWLERQGDLYVAMNSPFYIKGLANGDVLSLNLDGNGYVENWDIIRPSTNSTIWLIEHENTSVADKLKQIGCEVERDAANHVLSVSVPESVPYDGIDAVLRDFEHDGLVSVAIPVDRMK